MGPRQAWSCRCDKSRRPAEQEGRGRHCRWREDRRLWLGTMVRPLRTLAQSDLRAPLAHIPPLCPQTAPHQFLPPSNAHPILGTQPVQGPLLSPYLLGLGKRLLPDRSSQGSRVQMEHRGQTQHRNGLKGRASSQRPQGETRWGQWDQEALRRRATSRQGTYLLGCLSISPLRFTVTPASQASRAAFWQMLEGKLAGLPHPGLSVSVS